MDFLRSFYRRIFKAKGVHRERYGGCENQKIELDFTQMYIGFIDQKLMLFFG